MFPRASTDMKDKCKLHVRLFLSPRGILSNREACPLGRPLLLVWLRLVELSAALRALDTLAASLRSSSCRCTWAKRRLYRWSRYWYAMSMFLVASAGRTVVSDTTSLAVSHSACVSRTAGQTVVLVSSVVRPLVPGAWYLESLVRFTGLTRGLPVERNLLMLPG
jgi:hypothetical protein